MTRMTLAPLVSLLFATALGCGSGSASPTPPCNATCQDSTALLGLRDAIKLVYNLELNGKPVGVQSGMASCPLGGTGRVFGTATSNPAQGVSMVDLTYVFDHCGYSAPPDTDPTQVFSLTVTGTITEKGTIAVQPSATTALTFASDAVVLTGTVYGPPIPYETGPDGGSCPLMLGQSGNEISGSWCGRSAGVTL